MSSRGIWDFAFAVHSGGLALTTGNDLAELLQKRFADTEATMKSPFETPAASQPDEYHRLEIRLAKPGLKARTRESYYAQLSTATNNSSLISASQAQVGENEPYIPISRVSSMGRRNTQLEPALWLKTKLKSLARLDCASETLPWLGFDRTAKQIGSPGEVASDQLIR